MGSILKVESLEIPEIKLIEVYKSGDERGSNIKIFSKEELEKNGIDFSPLEILLLHSNKNVLRGLHYQKQCGQSRIISCIRGEVFVAIVDINDKDCLRKRNCVFTLKKSNQYIYIPTGYALGTYAIEESDIICMCGEHPFKAKYAAGVRWDDVNLKIEWPVGNKNVILSENDNELPDLESLMKELNRV